MILITIKDGTREQTTLQSPSLLVKDDDNITELVSELFRVLKETRSWGVSAIQLGVHLQVCVLDMQPLPPICMVNPRIDKGRGKDSRKEGCLSCPGLIIETVRCAEVRVVYQNQYRKPQKITLKGIQARAMQHEIDHMQGILLIDRIPKEPTLSDILLKGVSQ